MNTSIVMDELHCDRDWAIQLLTCHSWDPVLVRSRETNFDTLVSGNLDNGSFVLSELRTSWGTTVLCSEDSDLDCVVAVRGKYVRADPDYLRFEWIEPVQPLAAALTLKQASGAEGLSTEASTDSESVSFCSSSSSSSVPLYARGDMVFIDGLRSSPELNGVRGRVVRHMPDTHRYEVKVPGLSGTKALRVSNLSSFCSR